ncbi:hypothetical protein SGRIM128S_07345 [Streptomyces griseomycini]
MRQPLSTRVQLRVRQRLPTEHHRRTLRPLRHPRLEQRRHRRPHTPGTQPTRRRHTLLRHQHVHLTDTHRRTLGDRGQDADEPFGDRVGGASVEEVGAEFHGTAQAGGCAAVPVPFLHDEGEVELRGTGADGVPGHGESGQLSDGVERGLPVGAVDREGHLEQGMTAPGPLGVERVDEALEGDVLVVVGRQVGGAHPVQQFGEGGVAGGVGAQHERVDEEADQVLECLVVPSGDGGADRHVRARAEPRQEGGERGLDDHEEAGSAAVGEPQQTLVDLCGDLEGDLVTLLGRDQGPRVVGGQGQFGRQPGERPGPVGQLLRDHGARVVLGAEVAVLPQAVVGVLNGQRSPVRCPALGAGGVGGDEIAGQRLERPAVGGRVMDHQHQHVLARAEGVQPGTQWRVRGEVDAGAGGVGEHGVQPVLGDVLDGQAGQGLGRVQDLLAGSSGVLGEDGAQRLVPGDEVQQGRPQGVVVEVAGQPQRGRDVVGGAGSLEVLEEPQPLLCVRQGDALRPGLGAGQRGARRVGRTEPPGQFGDGGRLEQGPYGQFGTEGGTDAADEPGGEERVPAEGEEALVDADLVLPEHLAEQGAQGLLARRARAAAPGLVAVHRAGQGPLVDLAVGGERQGVQRHDRHGHHVVGQVPREVFAQVGGVRKGRDTGGRHGVGDEPLVTGPVLAHHDGTLSDLGMAGQRRLDLAEFDAEAADLDLVIGASQVLQTAVPQTPCQVTGAVHPRAVTGERVRHEPLGRQPRTVQIARRGTTATDIHLPRHAERHRTQPLVQHVHPQIRDALTDQAARLPRRQLPRSSAGR